jgi:hypothetical protein
MLFGSCIHYFKPGTLVRSMDYSAHRYARGT